MNRQREPAIYSARNHAHTDDLAVFGQIKLVYPRLILENRPPRRVSRGAARRCCTGAESPRAVRAGGIGDWEGGANSAVISHGVGRARLRRRAELIQRALGRNWFLPRNPFPPRVERRARHSACAAHPPRARFNRRSLPRFSAPRPPGGGAAARCAVSKRPRRAWVALSVGRWGSLGV